MKLNVYAVNFDMTEKLNLYIEKKTKKYNKNLPDGAEMEFRLTVTKREAAMNKETQLRILGLGQDVFAQKVCDTFEQGVDETLAAAERQLERLKEKM